MSVSSIIADGLQSLATRLGTSNDKASTVSYNLSLLTDMQLESAFRTSWIMRKVVMAPCDDAVRKWRHWTASDLEAAKRLAAAEKQLQIRNKIREAYWKSRLWGGAVILIGVGNDLEAPLNVDAVGEGDLQYITVLTRRDINPGELEDDPRQARFGRPRLYQISTSRDAIVRVHPSRLVEFRGAEVPWRNSPVLSSTGWGDSVLQAVYDACRHLDSTMANIASLVFDAKTDIVKIPGLTENITDRKYETALVRRFELARMLKGNHGTLILDEQEDYDSKSYSFGGLDNIALRFMQTASGASDIPMTRLLGTSPAGMNSTGEHDMLNYYDRVSADQELIIGPAMEVLDEVFIRHVLGNRPEDVSYEWNPLKQMTDKEKSEIRRMDADTVLKLSSSGTYKKQDVNNVGAEMFAQNGIRGLQGTTAPDDPDPAPGQTEPGTDPFDNMDGRS